MRDKAVPATTTTTDFVDDVSLTLSLQQQKRALFRFLATMVAKRNDAVAHSRIEAVVCADHDRLNEPIKSKDSWGSTSFLEQPATSNQQPLFSH
jgi:hypothetical protein